MSLWTLTSFISSWILHWKSTEGAPDLTSTIPSSREESVMEIAPDGEQDHLLAQRKWRSKSRVNSGESPLIAAIAQERTPLRSRVTGRGTPGEEELGCYLRVCVHSCQQHGALLTLTMGDRLGGIIAQVNEHVNTYVQSITWFFIRLLSHLCHIIRTDFSLLYRLERDSFTRDDHQ